MEINHKNANKNYTVIKPGTSFKNKSYTEWVQDWSNWLYQINPDQNNEGDVVFLRGMSLSEGWYGDNPNVMIGSDSLEISAHQGILIPIITANYVADNDETPQYLYGMVRNHILGGDHPPIKAQVKINDEFFDDNDQGTTDLRNYEIETPIFTIYIPDSSEGESLKDRVEVPIQSSGFFPAVTRGYFILLQLKASEKPYYIQSYATGAKTANGPYHVSMLYSIVVKESLSISRPPSIPFRHIDKIKSVIFKKEKAGEIDKIEADNIKTKLENSSKEISSIVKKLHGKS